MFGSKEVSELLGISRDVMRDRKRRFGDGFYFGKTDGKLTVFESKDLLGLAIAEGFIKEGLGYFEAARRSYWVYHEVALHCGLLYPSFLRLFPRSSSPYIHDDYQNLGRPKAFAAFAENQNPIISDTITTQDLRRFFDTTSTTLIDLQRLAEKVPPEVLSAIHDVEGPIA